MTRPSGRSRARRELTLALVLCAAGAAMVLASATRGWVSVDVARASPLPAVAFTETGRDVEPLVAALGVVGLAGVVGLLATRRTGRLVLGALLAVAGVAVVLRALAHLAAPSRDHALALLDAHGPVVSVRSDGAVSAHVHVLWPAATAGGGLLLCAGGLATVLRARSWPGMSSRYDPPAPRRAPDNPSREAAARAASSQDLWDALDRGEDPTSC